jgi:hypothetical protein
MTGGNMHYPGKLMLAALAATLTLAFAVATATAGSLRTSDTDIYIIWDDELSERLSIGFGPITECNVTLLGHFDTQTITKVKEKTGDIDHAEIAGCEPAPVVALDETLPWDLTFQSFTGRLPAIERVRLLLTRAAFLFDFASFAECLGATTEANPIAGEALIGAGGAVRGFDYASNETTPIIDLPNRPFSFLCDGQEMLGDGTADVENGAGADIDITLI